MLRPAAAQFASAATVSDVETALAGGHVRGRRHSTRDTEPAVVVDGVWKRFGSTDVVADLSFDVRPGEMLGFLGPNGAGKTTTMRMILDIIRPDRGSISVFGGAAGRPAPERGSGTCRRTAACTATCRCIETLTYFGALRGLPTTRARERARRSC